MKKKQRTTPSGRCQSAKIRKAKVDVYRRILGLIGNDSHGDAAERMGLERYDVKNILNGYIGLDLIIKMVRSGRYAPESLLQSGKPRRLSKAVSTRNVQKRLIAARIRELAKDGTIAELAAKTTLADPTLYGLRRTYSKVGLEVVLGFVYSGVRPRKIFFG
ncbi:MAG: hypothetical protein VX246_16025 [Myxococcota bacterium]|nr:hypothetical protein [Myxococcota bacterium]